MWLRRKDRSPYYYAQWRNPDTGRTVSVSTGEVATRAAEARGRELEAEWHDAQKRAKGGGFVTTETVIEEYWNSELSKRKWAASAKVHILRIIDHLGPSRLYCEVTVADVAAFVDKLDGVLSDSTINRNLAVWRRLHNTAQKKRLYPVHSIDWSQVTRDEPEGRTRILSPDELTALLYALPRHLCEIVVFALLTGARRSQVATLQWERVDLEHGCITVFKKHRKAFVPHVVELHPKAVEILMARGKEVAGDGKVDGKSRVFNTTNFQHGWEKAVKAAGIANFRFHDLRHTSASWLARKANLNIVRQQLGHADLRMTLRYSHTNQEDVKSAVHALPDLTVPVGPKLDAED